nr:DUF3040 domain-containing protein [Microbacterium sp. TNHR37B]
MEDAKRTEDGKRTRVNPVETPHRERQGGRMTTLAVILLLVGIALLLLGVFVKAAEFLLWIGLVIIVIAIIAWLMRVIRRNA